MQGQKGRHTENCYRKDQEQIDEEELRDRQLLCSFVAQKSTCLEIAEVGSRSVEEADSRELYRRIQAHILEAAEAGNKCCSPFPATLLAYRAWLSND